MDLKEDGSFDFDGIRNAINERTKVVTNPAFERLSDQTERFRLQKSGRQVAFVKNIRENIICMVDNCYGEFTELSEPTDVGVDMMAGSLIKNPGGGLAPVGGYIVGKKECVENAPAV